MEPPSPGADEGTDDDVGTDDGAGTDDDEGTDYDNDGWDRTISCPIIILTLFKVGTALDRLGYGLTEPIQPPSAHPTARGPVGISAG